MENKVIDQPGQILLRNVTKVYGSGRTQIRALNNISAEFSSGSVVTVMGPSGSGKTTLLNMIGGIDSPTSGSIIVDGLDISYMKESKLAEFRHTKVGFVFQAFYLFPYMSVMDNVLVPLVPYGVSKEDRLRAGQLLDTVHLSAYAKQKAINLSGGEMQRVAIARALIFDPPIILADEPTGNLDSVSGQVIVDLLCSLSLRNKIVIIVTHNLAIGQSVHNHPKGRNIWMTDGYFTDSPSTLVIKK